MPSSPTEDTLLRIAELYDSARLELREGAARENTEDLERVRGFLAEVETLLGAIGDPEGDEPAERAAREKSQEAHRALIAAMTGQRQQAREMLADHRKGRRVLAAYGRKHTVSGTRIEQDG